MPQTRPMRPARRQRAFTMIELMIVVALIGVVLTLVGPSFLDYIVVQRLKGVNTNLMTDMQYARSEAISRGKVVFLIFGVPMNANDVSCYTLYTDANNLAFKCNCKAPEGSRCNATAQELKTVVVPPSESVRFSLPAGQAAYYAIDPITGAIKVLASDTILTTINPFYVDQFIDGTRKLHTTVSPSGRPATCVPAGAVVSGVKPC